MTLTPEEVVFRTNSDSKSIVFVFPDKLVYVEEGAYGGYILKPKDVGLEEFTEGVVSRLISNARAFYVVPEIRELEDLGEYAVIAQRFLNTLPEKVRKKFENPSGKELITYKYVEVDVRIKKCTENYAVLDFESKPNGLKLTAKALRLYLHWQGSRRYPESTTAGRLVKEWKLEFPDNEVIQKYMYAKNYTGYRGRGSTIYLKIVLEAPRELVPTSAVAPATTKKEIRPIAIKGFLVISRLPSKALLNAALPEIFRNIKIGKKEIRLVMGYFYNKLGTLSRKFYCQILPEYAVDAGFGYIVPKDKVSLFLREVDELKKEYEEFEQQLKDFLLYGRIPLDIDKRAKVYREYLNIVMEYLKKHGKDEEVKKKIESLKIAERVRISLLPFSIDYSIIEEFVDDRVKARVSKEIETLSREIVEAARKRIEERVMRLLERVEKLGVEKLTEKNVEVLKRELDGIIREAEEFGIDSAPLRKLSVALENPEDIAKTAMEVKASSERLKALIKLM